MLDSLYSCARRVLRVKTQHLTLIRPKYLPEYFLTTKPAWIQGRSDTHLVLKKIRCAENVRSEHHGVAQERI